MKTVRDMFLPYALFFIGLVIGLSDAAYHLIGTPLHEIGHVVGAFATGGWGVWDITRWNVAVTSGGNYIVIAFAGVFFHHAAGTGIAAVLLVFRKATWLGGLIMGTVIVDIPTHHLITDWEIAPRYAPDMTKAIHILKWFYLAIIVIALVASITRTIILHQKT